MNYLPYMNYNNINEDNSFPYDNFFDNIDKVLEGFHTGLINPQFMIDVDNMIKDIRHDENIWDTMIAIINYLNTIKNHIHENYLNSNIDKTAYKHIITFLDLIEAKLNITFYTKGSKSEYTISLKNEIYQTIERAINEEIFQETMIWKEEMNFLANESD